MQDSFGGAEWSSGIIQKPTANLQRAGIHGYAQQWVDSS